MEFSGCVTLEKNRTGSVPNNTSELDGTKEKAESEDHKVKVEVPMIGKTDAEFVENGTSASILVLNVNNYHQADLIMKIVVLEHLGTPLSNASFSLVASICASIRI